MTETVEQAIKELAGPIAVFGAGGFIGANLFRRLFSVRDDVYALTHEPFVPWRLISLDQQKIVRCDIRRSKDVQSLFERYKFRAVFCLSAYGGYSRQTDVERIYETNFFGLLNIFQAASVVGVDAIVHAGTSSEYGTNSNTPDESGQLAPNSHYAVSKASCSYLTQYVGRYQSVPAVNLRLYSVYGPWEEPDRLVPQLIQNALQNEYPPLVDPDVARDFVFVEDALNAFILAARRARPLQGQSINIATGTQTTLREIVDETRKLFGITKEPVWSSMANRSWDLKQWRGNPQRARDLLGWQAETTLAKGMRLTRDWAVARTPNSVILPSVRASGPVRLSVVIACYRDEAAIPSMYERLTRVCRVLKVDYELIFVNDASPDHAHETLARLCESDDRVIEVEHSRNFGSQNAFLSGMSIATGDVVILMDGDLQDPPELISGFYEKWAEGYEVVFGRRVKREGNWILNICFKGFYRLFNWMAYIPIPVDAGDFSLLDRRVYLEILRMPETDQFLRGLRAWVGFRQTSVDYDRPQRPFGRSTNSWIKNIWWARKGIFSFSFIPLDLLFYGGIMMTALSIAALVFQILYRLGHPNMPTGFATVIVLILFFGGLQLMGLSVIGEYVGKVLEESKHRPKYIRRSIRSGKKVFSNSDEIGRFISSRSSPP